MSYEPISFWVQGIPKPQPRNRSQPGKKGRTYDPGTAEGWRSRVWQVAQEHKPTYPFAGPVSLWVVFYLKRPGRLLRKKDPEGIIICDEAGDGDNYGKCIMDELEGMFYLNDKQIADLRVQKYWTAKPPHAQSLPGCKVSLRRMATNAPPNAKPSSEMCPGVHEALWAKGVNCPRCGMWRDGTYGCTP